jgi:hypothetical protein
VLGRGPRQAEMDDDECEAEDGPPEQEPEPERRGEAQPVDPVQAPTKKKVVAMIT